MKNFISALTIMALSLSQALACDINGQSGFAPKNDMYIGVDEKGVSSITQEIFSKSMDRVYDIYAPIVKSKGGQLEMVKNWTSGEVNASASRSPVNPKIWTVEMFGGLARHPLMTTDGFMMVICHELGHQIGGAPIIARDWAANEGQADYFASLKCLRRILEKDDNVGIVAGMNIEPVVTKKCEAVYKSANEVAICQRIGTAAKVLAKILSGLDERSTVNHSTPDLKVVMRTNDNHPAAQCRLDTYFQGALCDKSFSIDVDNKDPIIGSCVKRDGYIDGVRPLCWYKPGSNEI
jgi:hypothetical protein